MDRPIVSAEGNLSLPLKICNLYTRSLPVKEFLIAEGVELKFGKKEVWRL
jgi:hypothetical protein